MLSFVKKLILNNLAKQQYYNVDLHSHLIPAIDDGTRTMEESLHLIQELEHLGFKKLIITPHTMSHRFNNSSKEILQKFQLLQNEIKKQKININLAISSEYYLDEHFFSLLEKKDILTFGDNFLLFEHSYKIKPPQYESLLFEIKVAGYKPVLAHPERYLFLHKNFELYKRLKEMGIYFQLNLNSLSGYYSKDVQKVAHKLVEKGWIDFIGSDIHNNKHLNYFKANLQSKNIKKIFQYNTILNQQLL